MKHNFEGLDLTLNTYELDNGLKLYVIPNNKLSNIYVTFTTKFGSRQSEFVPNGEKKMVKVPDGVAHFLEHKLFEQPDGVDPFEFFSQNGADANANTSQFRTSFLFSGVDNYEKNLSYLLDYVQTPYFTDKNVEKEKGIIEQELKMYYDNPSSRIFEQTIFNTFKEDPVRLAIGGTVKSIKDITKEDLYLCYNTFYHPANMFVVVTGNVDPDTTYQIVKNNQDNKEYTNSFSLKVKNYKETDEVFKKKETLKMNVTIPKVSLGYKINIKKIKDFENVDILYYLGIYFDIIIGSTSTLAQELKEAGIISYDIDSYGLDITDYYYIYIESETKKTETFLEKLKQAILNKKVTKEEFDRKRKVYMSAYITMSDNIFAVNNQVVNNVVKYSMVYTDIYNRLNNYNFDDFMKIINEIDFTNNSSVIIIPKK